MDKKTFVMYISWGAAIDNMDDHEAAAFLRQIYALERGQTEQEDIPDGLRIFWPLAKEKLCEDMETYKTTCDKRAEAGRKGNQKRWKNSKNRNCDNSDSKPSQKSQEVANIADNESEYESEYEYDNTLKGVNNARTRETHTAYNPETLKNTFESPELAEQFGVWMDCRFADPATYPPAAIADDLSKAKRYEKEYSAKAVIDVLKASLSYKRPVWDRLARGKPKGGTENGFDYLQRRIAEEEAKEKANAG